MIKLKYNVRPSIQVEVDVNDQLELFKSLAEIQEIMGEDTCKKCGGVDTSFVVREVDGNTFHEIRCNNKGCRAILSFGKEKKSGRLYPRRYEVEGKEAKKDADGKVVYLPNEGWVAYNPKTGQKE